MDSMFTLVVTVNSRLISMMCQTPSKNWGQIIKTLVNLATFPPLATIPQALCYHNYGPAFRFQKATNNIEEYLNSSYFHSSILSNLAKSSYYDCHVCYRTKLKKTGILSSLGFSLPYVDPVISGSPERDRGGFPKSNEYASNHAQLVMYANSENVESFHCHPHSRLETCSQL